MNRRGFLFGLASGALAAPAIVRSGILMPVKSFIMPREAEFVTYAAFGNREELNDIIYKIAPIDTPFINLITAGSNWDGGDWWNDELTPI